VSVYQGSVGETPLASYPGTSGQGDGVVPDSFAVVDQGVFTESAVGDPNPGDPPGGPDTGFSDAYANASRPTAHRSGPSRRTTPRPTEALRPRRPSSLAESSVARPIGRRGCSIRYLATCHSDVTTQPIDRRSTILARARRGLSTARPMTRQRMGTRLRRTSYGTRSLPRRTCQCRHGKRDFLWQESPSASWY
jgi:hypothetical protein